MKITHQNIAPFSVAAVVEKELPFVGSMDNQSVLDAAKDCYQFYEKNAGRMPMVMMTNEYAERMAKQFQEYTVALVYAMNHLIHDPQLFGRYLKTGTLSSQDLELMRQLALNSWKQGDIALYGRFDAATNPDGSLKGIYEYNGDTPTMLFESVNIQNMITDGLFAKGHTSFDQYNDLWGDIIENLGNRVQGKRVAVLCTIGAIEDVATGETLAQMFEEAGADVRLTSIEDFHVGQYDHGWEFNLSSEPTFRPEVVFTLLPWEEMLVHGRDFLMDQARWAQPISFVEPAWKWVMGHKGLMVYLTDLLEGRMPGGQWLEALDLPHLRTSFSAEGFKGRYVSKPVVGQRSMNVTVHEPGGQVVSTMPGPFGDDVMVYQEYCEPEVTEIGKVIACGWTSFDSNNTPAISTLAFRAFDSELKILDQINERIIPHVLQN